MISFFNRNRIFVVFFLPILALLPGGIGIINAEAITIQKAMPLFDVISFMLPLTPWFLSLLALIVILLLSILANNIMSSHELHKNTFVPALIFMLFSLSYKTYVCFTPLLLSNLMILLILHDIFSLGKEDSSINTVFQIGLFVGIASLIYFPIIGYLLLAFIGISIYRMDVLKEWFIVLSAFLIPWFFMLFVYFWFDKLDVILNVISLNFRPSFFLAFDLKKSYFYFFIVLVFLFGFIRFLTNSGYGNVKLRKNKMVIVWMMIINVGIFFFSGSNWVDFLVLMTFPFAVVITTFLLSFRKAIVAEVFFWLIFFAVTYNIFMSKFTIL